MTLNEIQAEMVAAGSQWWNPSNMKMFGTLPMLHVYNGENGIFFVTRDNTFDGRRRYTVRQYDPQEKKINTIGEICQYRHGDSAKKEAKRLAGKGSAEADRFDPITILQQFHLDCCRNGSPHADRNDTNALIGAAKRHHRLMEDYCNGREMYDTEGKPLPALRKLRSLISGLAKVVGATGVIFSGDPRGCTVKLQFPNGATNDFGREGWCIPTELR